MPHASAADGEFAVIRRFLAGLDQGPAVALGVGDDAALLNLDPGEQLAVSTDTLVEGIHFPADSPPEQFAYRAVAAAASDLAAMGARPLGMTLALTVPRASSEFLGALRRGLTEAVDAFELPLVGGDLCRGPLSLSVTVLGGLPAGRALRRDGAQVGDSLFVSGPLGASAAGLALLQGGLDVSGVDRDALLAAFWRPRPDLALGQALRDIATAAIDVSDGLLADLGHIARASGVQLRVDSADVPRPVALATGVNADQAMTWALSGGEDYVLCFTLPPGINAPAGCQRIGAVLAGTGVSCDFEPLRAGYTHF